MGFFKAIQSCFKKYSTGFGRATRSEFWFFYLFSVIVTIAAAVVDVIFFPHKLYGYGHDIGPTEITLNLFLLMPWLAVSTRRLHDVGKSGMWFLLSLTIIGILPLLYWFCKPGDPDDNSYGKPPLAHITPPPSDPPPK